MHLNYFTCFKISAFCSVVSGGTVVNWLRSSLSGKIQQILYDGRLSDITFIIFDEGSLIDPILFILYTVELFNIIASYGLDCHSYAEDDTQVYVSVPAKDTLNPILGLEYLWSRLLWLRMGRVGSPNHVSRPLDVGEQTKAEHWQMTRLSWSGLTHMHGNNSPSSLLPNRSWLRQSSKSTSKPQIPALHLIVNCPWNCKWQLLPVRVFTGCFSDGR